MTKSREPPPVHSRQRGGRLLILAGIAGLVIFFAMRRHSLPPMIMAGDGGGSYPLIRYERNYFYRVGPRVPKDHKRRHSGS